VGVRQGTSDMQNGAIEGAAKASGYLIEEFKHLPQYQQRGMLLEQKRRERR
jgi:hypothetical protein